LSLPTIRLLLPIISRSVSLMLNLGWFVLDIEPSSVLAVAARESPYDLWGWVFCMALNFRLRQWKVGALRSKRYDSAKVIGEDDLTLRWSRLLKSDLQKLKFVCDGST
jgi:hypothetical protein